MSDSLIKKLEKKYESPILRLVDNGPVENVKAISTGLVPLDIATGVGGIPLGKFVEIYSQEGVGKTTLCIQISARAQKLGYQVAYIDMEHRFDLNYARMLGLDLSKMLFTQPPHAEAALNIARELIAGDISRLIIIDSAAALVPKAEVEGQVGDQFPGLQARIMSQNLRITAPLIKEKEATVIFINQLRAKMGGNQSFAYGPQEDTPTGKALKYYTSMRIEMKRIKTLQKNNVPYGHIARVTIRKNSVAAPLRSADLTFRYGVGFDATESIIDLAIQLGLIVQSGSWFEIGGEKYHGRDSIYSLLEGNEQIRESLMEKISADYTPSVAEYGQEDD